MFNILACAKGQSRYAEPIYKMREKQTENKKSYFCLHFFLTSSLHFLTPMLSPLCFFTSIIFFLFNSLFCHFSLSAFSLYFLVIFSFSPIFHSTFSLIHTSIPFLVSRHLIVLFSLVMFSSHFLL